MSYSLAFSHFGIFVTDMARMVDFYTGFLGFAISDRAKRPQGGEICFLTRDPREHHQLVLASGRPADLGFNMVNQMSFRVDSLATLREMHRELEAMRMKEIRPITHGNALSVYFRDPEHNRIELLIDTPWYVPQPYRVPIDLRLADDALWAGIEQQVKVIPGFKTHTEWLAEIKLKIAQASAARRSVTV
jgi:catechol 2,3-dioxygenase-like lactoylglutathione lyase family enzyme